MRSLHIALPLLLAFASPSVFADQVGFKNGDRLTGAIMKSDAKSLLITTAVAGQVTVSWQEIQEIRSDLPLYAAIFEPVTATVQIPLPTKRGAEVVTAKP